MQKGCLSARSLRKIARRTMSTTAQTRKAQFANMDRSQRQDSSSLLRRERAANDAWRLVRMDDDGGWPDAGGTVSEGFQACDKNTGSQYHFPLTPSSAKGDERMSKGMSMKKEQKKPKKKFDRVSPISNTATSPRSHGGLVPDPQSLRTTAAETRSAR